MVNAKAKFKVGDKVKLLNYNIDEKGKIFTITKKIYRPPRRWSAIRHGHFRYKLESSRYNSYSETELQKHICTLKSLLE